MGAILDASTSRRTSPSCAEPLDSGGSVVPAADVARAIATVEASRQTHVEWRDYWLALGDGVADCKCGRDHSRDADIAGDLAHHVECIAGYDHVLTVLRALLDTP